MSSSNLYGFSNEPTTQYLFQAPTSKKARMDEPMLTVADRPTFESADGRTSYSTQTVYDVKITLAHNQKTDMSAQLEQGHILFIDKTSPITVQYMNVLLATEPGLKNASAQDILKRFKYMGVVLSEDSAARGKNARVVHSQVFTVCVQGSCSIFDYWSIGGGPNKVRRYDDLFLLLKRVPCKNVQIDYAPNCPVHTLNEECWQVMPYNCRERIPPVKEYELGAYWYVGNIHEYATIGYDSAASMNNKNHVATQSHKLLTEFDMGRQIQVYIHSVLEPRTILW